MEEIRRDNLEALFTYLADEMAANYDKLTEMDALLGDGDLGLTMKKGFGALPEIISSISEPDIGRTVAKAGMKLSSVIPSTMGFLMSSGLLSGGKAISGAEAVGPGELAQFLRGFAEGIVKRGKCAPGDRTVLDAVAPAAMAAEELIKGDGAASLLAVAKAAEEAAAAGLEKTRSMKPKFGKAAVHMEAARGTEDQGAFAGLCFMVGIRKFVEASV